MINLAKILPDHMLGIKFKFCKKTVKFFLHYFFNFINHSLIFNYQHILGYKTLVNFAIVFHMTIHVRL